MPVVRFNPARGFESVYNKMNELFGDMDKSFSLEVGGFNPRADIIEEEKQVTIYIELPGIAKEQVNISINEDRILNIKGEKKVSQQCEGKSFIRNERQFGEFSRKFVLPDNLDIEHVSANYDKGLLTLTINKIEPPKPKEININVL